MRTRSFVAIVAALLACAGTAHAKSPVQISPDDTTTTSLVNKTVGSEQWVITLNFNDDTVTGNVFDLTGKPPTFFFCDVNSDNGFVDPVDLQGQNLTLDCQVAGGCSALPCTTDWQTVADPIVLPGSFFLP